MKKLSIFILTSLLSLPAFADNALNSGWYGGIGIVQSSLDESVRGDIGVFRIEYDKINIKGFIGNKITDNISIEIHYTDYRKNDLDVTLNGRTVPGIDGDGDSYGIALLYHSAPADGISGFVKLGYHKWDVNISAAGLAADDDGTDLFYGAGVDIKLADKWALRFDFERLELDDSSSDINNIGISAIYNF